MSLLSTIERFLKEAFVVVKAESLRWQETEQKNCRVVSSTRGATLNLKWGQWSVELAFD